MAQRTCMTPSVSRLQRVNGFAIHCLAAHAQVVRGVHRNVRSAHRPARTHWASGRAESAPRRPARTSAESARSSATAPQPVGSAELGTGFGAVSWLLFFPVRKGGRVHPEQEGNHLVGVEQCLSILWCCQDKSTHMMGSLFVGGKVRACCRTPD